MKSLHYSSNAALIMSISAAAVLLLATFGAVASESGATLDGNRTDFAQYADPLVGTDFHGHTFPGATWPFGMVQLSPDTRQRSGDWDGCSGYHYSDSVIYGFSHTHLSGTGCDDLCDILLMPTYRGKWNCASGFSHDREHASPGYYEVYLDKPKVEARLSVGRRSGYHQYTFTRRRNARPQIVLDLLHRDYVLESSIEQAGPRAICGCRISKSWASKQNLYYWIEFDRDITSLKRRKKGALLSFRKTGNNILNVRVGISSVSTDAARENLLSDGLADMNEAKIASREAWNAYLGKIDVTSEETDVEKLRTFYSALYHTAIHPSLFSDADGHYRGMDGDVHLADGFERYHIFSLWDTFRALHPLFTIIERGRTVDFLKTFQCVYDECGRLPMWELAANETNCMIGFNAVSVIADAFAKGIDGVDYSCLLDAMVESARRHGYGVQGFFEDGAVLGEKEHESVSKTLEYAYNSWCISEVARVLGRQDIADEFLRYSAQWRNIFDPSTGFMRPRMNGRWLTPFNPREVNNHFTEANSWQYSFFVPQDIAGHIEALGGRDLYCAKIDSLFEAPEQTAGRTQADITGMIGQYAHGNEPSHHIPYLYVYAGRPWKTQQRVRQIMSTLYSSAPDGLCGNEDCGQMSAWYVLSSIGLYSVTPGSTTVALGSPVFPSIDVHVDGCGNLHISASSESGDINVYPYVSNVSVGGKPIGRCWIDFRDILSCNEISFTLQGSPDYDFGSSPKSLPPADQAGHIVPLAAFEMESDIIIDSMQVSLSGIADGARAWVSVTGSAVLSDGTPVPSGEAFIYAGPMKVENSATFEAWNVIGGKKSPVTRTALHKSHKDMKVEIHSHYNPQYSAGGDEGLIDGFRGSANWRTGGWQGYQGENFEAVVDLLSERPLNSIGAGFCQDARSWIWMPQTVEYSVSTDGKTFDVVGFYECGVDPQDYEIRIQDVELPCPEGTTARYVRVRATQLGTIPEWHPGAGGESFIFIDEIWVK